MGGPSALREKQRMDPGADQRKSPGADSFGRSVLHAAVECDRVERRLRVRVFRRGIEIVGAAREIALRSGCGSTQESGCGFLWPFGSPRFERLRLSRGEYPGAGRFGPVGSSLSFPCCASLAALEEFFLRERQ